MSSNILHISSQSSASTQSQKSCYEIADSFIEELSTKEPSNSASDSSPLCGDSILLTAQIGLDEKEEGSQEVSIFKALADQSSITSNPFLDTQRPEFKRINLDGGVIIGWSSQDQQAISDSETKTHNASRAAVKIEDEQTRSLVPPNFIPIKKKPWSSEEVSVLEEGLRKYGRNWGRILKDYGSQGTVSTQLSGRDATQLKDKARVLPGGNRYKREPKRSGGRKMNFWSSKELNALEHGMSVHGTCWASILADHGANGKMDQVLSNRTQLQLKDKARSERITRERLGKPLGIFALACSRPR